MNEITHITINGTPIKLITVKTKSSIKETETVVIDEYEDNMCITIPEHDAYLKMIEMIEMINNVLVRDNIVIE